MAPSRRKGSNRTSSAAAARRQWKVGDLVLAKVKGFPPWPATVSEPKKWGYATDRKKVLVYFFGTQQIAFCNPADVEAFTEEKKESLLGKRHGKSSDFVRALHEIIESYEKLKKQDEANNAIATIEHAPVSEDKSGELSNKAYINGETPAKTFQSCQKNNTTADEDDENVEIAAAVIGKDGLQVREMPAEEVSCSLVVTEMALANADSSREIFQSRVSQNRFTRRRPPSNRRARNPSRVDSTKLQNSITQFGGATVSVLRDGSERRNKRIRKSPDVSDGPDVDSLDLVSNGSFEGNDSEILTADSDSLSLNEGSTVESECKAIKPDSDIELCQRTVELSQRLDLQMNCIHKKKRMPNRKRPNQDIELAARPGEKVSSDPDVVKSELVLQCDQEKSSEKFPKEDGDEHLPLVKRARVRMGRTSSTRDEPETSLDMEEKAPEVCNSLSDHFHVSSYQEGDGSSDQNPISVEGETENSSPPNKYHALKQQKWEFRKNQRFGSSLDGEAALPPLKRLHRALEAMSANAAEDDQTVSDGPSTIKVDANGCCSSSSDDCSKLSLERKSGDEFGAGIAEEKDNLSNNKSHDGASQFSIRSDLPIKEGRLSSAEVATRYCNDCAKNKSYKEVVDSSDGKDILKSSSSDLLGAVVGLECSKSPSPKQAYGNNPGSPGVVLPSEAGGKSEYARPSEELDDKISQLSSNLLSGDSVNILSSSGTNLLMDNTNDKFDETAEFCQLIPEENRQDNGMSNEVEESEPTIKDSAATLRPVPMDVMSNVNVDQDQSRSNSVSEDHSGDKTVSISQSSSMTNGLDSILRAMSHASTCNISVSVNNSVQVNGSCSPAVHSHPDIPKAAGKWNYKEAHAALTSFEAILGTLTRTKESIGRATRSAIDCAKFGGAAKVVEILAHNLERESSLHRRVDLFFLVDSIAQCSRGLKGDVGGIYPSAILAVLPRLLSAAAPPGSSSQENRRQCLKVLRVWQERRILPESIVRHHIRELDSLCGSSCSRSFSRRLLRNERAFDDPIREMEGMLVDEYGSNSSIQLPGFRMPPMLRDEDDGVDSDGESFEAVTPEHDTEKSDGESKPIPVVEKHRHILEDVDGELEMEDVAPSSEAVMASSNSSGTDFVQTLHHPVEHTCAVPYAPLPSKDVPPMLPPLPISPPPPPPPPPAPAPAPAPGASFPLPSEKPDSITNGLSSKLYNCLQNIEDDSRRSTIKQSIAPGSDHTISDAVQTSMHGRIDFQSPVPKHVHNSTNGSFSNPSTSHLPVCLVNNIPPADGAFNKGFRLRPPHPAPSNQFSYVQAEQREQSRRDLPPPSHSNRFHVQNTENVNFYRDSESMKFMSHDTGEQWRTPPFPGPLYSDGSRLPYARAPYTGQLGEPALPSNHWAIPPQAMNHRPLMPHRPPAGGPLPVAARGPNCWRPR